MKMKQYRAPDMRQALRQVREAQGPDAVILSSRKIHGGVEVVAAVDYDEVDSGVDTYGRSSDDSAPVAAARGPAPAPHCAAAADSDAEDFAALAQRLSGARAEADANAHVNNELRTLRHMLETQLATLAWNDLSRRAPLQTEMLKQLTMLGLNQELCIELVAQLPPRLELAEAQRVALAMIARRIAVVEERWMQSGGVVAMVGPTGVGKTTLIAKLAARWVMHHGARQLALVSTDSMRIGAQEQMHALGRLLGVPAYSVETTQQLPELLDQLYDRRLVLIDTAGLSQRDATLPRELTALRNASERIETMLVVSAAAQAGAIEQTIERFAPAQPGSCALTKLDEATSLGGALSALLRSALPLAYLSDGQRVPEDLSPARAHRLIARAVELSRKAGATADEDLLQRRFGAVAHALA
jgi:flagellar biosynthesis protein FlhF